MHIKVNDRERTVLVLEDTQDYDVIKVDLVDDGKLLGSVNIKADELRRVIDCICPPDEIFGE